MPKDTPLTPAERQARRRENYRKMRWALIEIASLAETLDEAKSVAKAALTNQN